MRLMRIRLEFRTILRFSRRLMVGGIVARMLFMSCLILCRVFRRCRYCRRATTFRSVVLGTGVGSLRPFTIRIGYIAWGGRPVTYLCALCLCVIGILMHLVGRIIGAVLFMIYGRTMCLGRRLVNVVRVCGFRRINISVAFGLIRRFWVG